MELTLDQALDICIEWWEWLTKTGLCKYQWPKVNLYPQFTLECPLCEYTVSHGGRPSKHCKPCPYFKHFRHRCVSQRRNYTYIQWAEAEEGSAKRKRYAAKFLAELKAIKEARNGQAQS